MIYLRPDSESAGNSGLETLGLVLSRGRAYSGYCKGVRTTGAEPIVTQTSANRTNSIGVFYCFSNAVGILCFSSSFPERAEDILSLIHI